MFITFLSQVFERISSETRQKEWTSEVSSVPFISVPSSSWRQLNCTILIVYGFQQSVWSSCINDFKSLKFIISMSVQIPNSNLFYVLEIFERKSGQTLHLQKRLHKNTHIHTHAHTFHTRCPMKLNLEHSVNETIFVITHLFLHLI